MYLKNRKVDREIFHLLVHALARARPCQSQELGAFPGSPPSMGSGVQKFEPCSAAFPGTSARSSRVSNHTHMGCQHHRMRLNQLCHSTGPQEDWLCAQYWNRAWGSRLWAWTGHKDTQELEGEVWQAKEWEAGLACGAAIPLAVSLAARLSAGKEHAEGR